MILWQRADKYYETLFKFFVLTAFAYGVHINYPLIVPHSLWQIFVARCLNFYVADRIFIIFCIDIKANTF